MFTMKHFVASEYGIFRERKEYPLANTLPAKVLKSWIENGLCISSVMAPEPGANK
jgi:hypothetical protein